MHFSEIHKMPTIKAAMTPFPHSLDIEDSAEKAVQLMSDHDIRHLPVTEKGALVGVLALRDLQHALAQSAKGGRASALRVRNLRLSPPYVASLGESLDCVLEQMALRHVDVALVFKGEKLAGIFTAGDACQFFADFLRSRFPEFGGDAA